MYDLGKAISLKRTIYELPVVVIIIIAMLINLYLMKHPPFPYKLTKNPTTQQNGKTKEHLNIFQYKCFIFTKLS